LTTILSQPIYLAARRTVSAQILHGDGIDFRKERSCL